MPGLHGTISAPGSQTQIKYDTIKMDYGKTYYWKIKATDNNGDSVESPIWYFTTEYNPYMPKNPNPTNGEIGVKIDTQLAWDGGDPEGAGDTVTYFIYFGQTNPPPSTPHGTVSAPGDVIRQKYNPGPLEYGKTYYWKIVARDLGGSSIEGPIWHFTTEYNPYMPSNPQPGNGTTGVRTDTLLWWDGGDPEGMHDIVTYTIYFGQTNPPPSTPHGTVSAPGDVTRQKYNPGALNGGVTYYWYVIAKDIGGSQIVGPIWMFTTIGIEPPTGKG
jgi:hypothetical protein